MRQESLAQLDPDTWEAVAEDEEHGPALLRVAQKPLRRLEAGELLYLLQRNLCLEHVVPVALDRLEGTPFLQAAQYPGDLLTALMEAEEQFWRDHREHWERVILLLGQGIEELEHAREAQELGEEDYAAFVGENLMAAALHFKGINAA
jgi:hypothetical protein